MLMILKSIPIPQPLLRDSFRFQDDSFIYSFSKYLVSTTNYCPGTVLATWGISQIENPDWNLYRKGEKR